MQNRAQIVEINFLFVFFVSFYLSAVCVHHNFWESFTELLMAENLRHGKEVWNDPQEGHASSAATVCTAKSMQEPNAESSMIGTWASLRSEKNEKMQIFSKMSSKFQDLLSILIKYPH